MYGYIYRITDLTNGKCYIGQHKYDKPMLDPKYHGSSRILKNQIKKHPENFLEEIIFIAATLEEANYFETYFIGHLNTLYPNGYNLNHGGDKYIQSEKTKRSRSEKMKGENNPMHGVHRFGEENYFYGCHHTQEAKDKMSQWRKENGGGENHPRFISTLSFESLYQEYIINGKTLKECANIFNCNWSTVAKRLKKYGISKKSTTNE